ncbi:hypothetical protein MKW94_021234 [Papaver nudicaule]|uniref:pectinesterase n=1 Tax=Papaver nudicaule TaxID=74823 RepID=A0AA41UVP5_PAPNU|nr:hypothetical protein [Papaver nudicaule]
MLFSQESHLLVLVFVLVCCQLGVSKADDGRNGITCVSSEVSRTITVDPQPGQAEFTTVQAAVDSIPPNNTDWIAIHLNPGLYREQVNIPQGKSCILLLGDDKDRNSIEWGNFVNSDNQTAPTYDSATFTSWAENFVARRITFKNTYSLEDPSLAVHRAVAATIFGDKSSFEDCGFIGVQDTLADALGRHYFYNCYIEGAYDFIWGNGQSIYDECEILVREHPTRNGNTAYITAQGRATQDQTTGFVFKNGRLNGAGNARAYLGRAWYDYSTVIYYNMIFSSNGLLEIVPPRWHDWGKPTAGIVYAEGKNTGPGSEIDVNNVVGWAKINFTDADFQPYIDLSFIDQEGWLSNQPRPL